MSVFTKIVFKLHNFLDRNKIKNNLKFKPNLTSKTLVFAHRGSKSNCPENTLVAFREAVLIHADEIELDVHLSIDDELIVIHDKKIDRTRNGKGLVKNMKAKDLKKFDAGS